MQALYKKFGKFDSNQNFDCVLNILRDFVYVASYLKQGLLLLLFCFIDYIKNCKQSVSV